MNLTFGLLHGRKHSNREKTLRQFKEYKSNMESSEMSHFLSFEMHQEKGFAKIKPAEIVAISPAPKGGSRIVTKQGQLYYVIDEPCDVEARITLHFKNLKTA